MTPAELSTLWSTKAAELELQAKQLTAQEMYDSAQIKRISARQLRDCIEGLLTLATTA